MDSLCACGPIVNMRWMWDSSSSWIRCKRTAKLSTVSRDMSPVVSPATASISACNTWICVEVGALYIVSEVVPKEMTVGIHVRWTWWPGAPTLVALWKSIRQDMATSHTQHVQDDIRCLWARTIMLDKCCVHIPSSQNGRNNLILLLLHIRLSSYGSLHKDQSNNHLLTEQLSIFFRMTWRPHDSVWTSRHPESRVLLFHKPSRWKWASSLNPGQPEVAGYAVRHLAQCVLFSRLQTP